MKMLITHDIEGNFYLLPHWLTEQFDIDDNAKYADPVFADHGMPVIPERAQAFQEKYAVFGIDIPCVVYLDDKYLVEV